MAERQGFEPWVGISYTRFPIVEFRLSLGNRLKGRGQAAWVWYFRPSLRRENHDRTTGLLSYGWGCQQKRLTRMA